jgi:hypothetical protein
MHAFLTDTEIDAVIAGVRSFFAHAGGVQGV